MERKSWLNTHSYRQTHIFAYNNNNKYKSKGFTLHTHIQTQTHVETETEQGKSTWKNVKKNCEKAEGNREKIAYVNVHRNVLPQHTHIHTHTPLHGGLTHSYTMWGCKRLWKNLQTYNEDLRRSCCLTFTEEENFPVGATMCWWQECEPTHTPIHTH